MKKWILIACYFLVLIQSSHAALNITGKVVSVSQQPVSGALVSLVNAGYNTISDQNGIFKLTDANPVLKPTYNRTAAQYKFTIKGQTLQYYFPSNDLPCIVNIFSTSGKRIFTKNISQQEYGHIELFRHISQGQYVVQLETKKQQSVFSLQNLGTTLHLHDLTSRGPQISSFEKKATIISDTLLIQCASYTTRRIAIASYSLAIDTIVLSSITVNNDLATNADTLFTHAMLYFNNSVWDSASAFLSSYINKYPSGKSIESARYYYSRCLYETGNYSAARSGFIQFTKNYPSAALVDWVQYYIGQTWFGENNYDSARVWFSAVAQQYGDSLCGDDALYFTGRCDYELGKLSLAKSEFDILLSKYSLSSYRDGSSYHIGMCYYNLSSYDSAFTVFKSFMTNYPQSLYSDNALYYLSKCLYRLKRYSEAIAQFTSFLTSYPNSNYTSNAQLGIADCWFEQGVVDSTNYQKALKEYQTCLSSWPNGPTASSATEGAGESFYFIGQFDSARVYLSRIEKSYPQSVQVPSSLYFLGKCDMNDSLFQDAIKKFDVVLNTYPGSIKADNSLYQKARCQYYLHDYSSSLTIFKSYRTQYPQSAYCDNTYYYTVRIYITLNDCIQAKIQLSEMQKGYSGSIYLQSTQTVCQKNCP